MTSQETCALKAGLKEHAWTMDVIVIGGGHMTAQDNQLLTLRSGKDTLAQLDDDSLLLMTNQQLGSDYSEELRGNLARLNALGYKYVRIGGDTTDNIPGLLHAQPW